MLRKQESAALLKPAYALGCVFLTASLLVANGCSGHSSPNPPPGSPQQNVEFAYVANQGGSISGYSVNSSTGALTLLNGFPLTVGENPSFVTHDPQGRFLVMADIAAALVHVYSINTTTGALSEISPSPYPVAGEPHAVAFDPSGKFMYVVGEQFGNIAAFTVDANGVLSTVPGSPFAFGGLVPNSVVVNSTSQFIYVADVHNIYTFTINASTGAPTLASSVTGPTQPDGLALDPAGSLLYAVGAGSNSIESYTINSSTGALTPAQSSPMALQNGAFAIAIDPFGKFAYTSENDQSVVAYTLQRGAFTHIATYPGALGSLQLAIDPSGSFLYAPQTGNENNLSGFLVNASGELSAVPGSPTPTGHAPMSVTLVSE